MTIESPCIEVCQTSENGVTCIGCYRTVTEIANWQKLTDAEKMAVNASARERREAAKRKRVANQSS